MSTGVPQLPPPDQDMVELERLLAQANIGTQQFVPGEETNQEEEDEQIQQHPEQGDDQEAQQYRTEASRGLPLDKDSFLVDTFEQVNVHPQEDEVIVEDGNSSEDSGVLVEALEDPKPQPKPLHNTLDIFRPVSFTFIPTNEPFQCNSITLSKNPCAIVTSFKLVYTIWSANWRC